MFFSKVLGSFLLLALSLPTMAAQTHIVSNNLDYDDTATPVVPIEGSLRYALAQAAASDRNNQLIKIRSDVGKIRLLSSILYESDNALSLIGQANGGNRISGESTASQLLRLTTRGDVSLKNLQLVEAASNSVIMTLTREEEGTVNVDLKDLVVKNAGFDIRLGDPVSPTASEASLHIDLNNVIISNTTGSNSLFVSEVGSGDLRLTVKDSVIKGSERDNNLYFEERGSGDVRVSIKRSQLDKVQNSFGVNILENDDGDLDFSCNDCTFNNGSSSAPNLVISESGTGELAVSLKDTDANNNDGSTGILIRSGAFDASPEDQMDIFLKNVNISNNQQTGIQINVPTDTIANIVLNDLRAANNGSSGFLVSNSGEASLLVKNSAFKNNGVATGSGYGIELTGNAVDLGTIDTTFKNNESGDISP